MCQELNPEFIDGQICCPECHKIFFDRGKIGGTERWIPSHENCKGAGARVMLQPLTDLSAKKERNDFYRFIEQIKERPCSCLV